MGSGFDYATYALMWFVFSANTVSEQTLFKAGWFVESSLTQTLIVHIIQTAKISLLQSMPALPMLLITLTVITVSLSIPFSSIASGLGFVPLPPSYFP
jgi:Mg2+-importing ATPase